MLVSPSRTITIAGKSYVLDGSFRTLRTVQEAFNRDIVQILITIMDMRVDEVAKLIALAAGGTQDEIGQDILDDFGQTSRYVTLKTQLYAWIMVAITPKEEREKKSEAAEALILQATSLGQTTSDSPSAPSDGNPQNSGDPTSGN